MHLRDRAHRLPTLFLVDIKSTVRLLWSRLKEREAQSANDSMITSNIKSMLSSMQGKAHAHKNYKPHQPRFQVSKEYISSTSDSDLLVLTPCIQSNVFLKFTTMLDSGATKCFIDDSFVSIYRVLTNSLLIS